MFRTTKENGWEDVGIVNAQVKFYGVHAKSREEVFVAAGDGRIYRYDDSYQNRTGIRVTKETSIHGVAAYEDELVALGGGGRVFQRSDDTRWEECPVRPENDLYDISLGTPDIAVGDSGTVVERARERENMWGAGTSADDDQFDGRGEAYDGDGTEPA